MRSTYWFRLWAKAEVGRRAASAIRALPPMAVPAAPANHCRRVGARDEASGASLTFNLPCITRRNLRAILRGLPRFNGPRPCPYLHRSTERLFPVSRLAERSRSLLLKPSRSGETGHRAARIQSYRAISRFKGNWAHVLGRSPDKERRSSPLGFLAVATSTRAVHPRPPAPRGGRFCTTSASRDRATEDTSNHNRRLTARHSLSTGRPERRRKGAEREVGVKVRDERGSTGGFPTDSRRSWASLSRTSSSRSIQSPDYRAMSAGFTRTIGS